MPIYIIMADYEVPKKYYLSYKDAEKALKEVNEDRMMGGAMTKAYIVELELGGR